MPSIKVSPNLEQRFWVKVDRKSQDECWLWKAGKNFHGYGSFSAEGRTVGAHNVSYLILRGEYPDGLELDHLCRNRACVNPFHLEPVTHMVNVSRSRLKETRGVNNSRKTHCPRGHEYTKENTYIATKQTGIKSRECRICRKLQKMAYLERKNNTAVSIQPS